MHDLGYRHVVEGEPGGSEAWKTLASAAARHEEIPVGHGEMRAALSQEISAEVDGGQITEGQGKGGVVAVVSERSGKAPMVALNLVDPDRVTDTGRAIQPVGSRSGDEHGPAPAGVSLCLLVNEEVALDRVVEMALDLEVSTSCESDASKQEAQVRCRRSRCRSRAALGRRFESWAGHVPDLRTAVRLNAQVSLGMATQRPSNRQC